MSTSTTVPTTTPNPSIMAKFVKAPAKHGVVIAADLSPADPGRTVRPGTRQEYTGETHDGVVKAKQLRKGMVVRSYLNGAPRGSVKVIEKVTRVKGTDGAMVLVTFSSAHAEVELKAAYRFHCAELEGTPVASDIPAFVAYEEV